MHDPMTTADFTDGRPSVSALARPGSRVLLAGTAHYPAAGDIFPDVPAVSNSLSELAGVLRDKCRIGTENLAEPLIDPSGKLELVQAVRRVAEEASDTLLVYYIGHGMTGSQQELYLGTKATDGRPEDLSSKALSYSELLEPLRATRAETVVVVLDCCYSGRGRPAARVPIDSVFERAFARGGFLLTSAGPGDRALVAPGGNYTLFTGTLMRLLRDGDRYGPREVTLEHAYRFLKRELPEANEPHAHRTNMAGELVLAPNPAYRVLPAWPPERQPGTHPASDTVPEAGPPDLPSPFRGLLPFGPDDEKYFSGREDLIAKITRCVSGPGRLHAVTGPSGSGKTSLLRAAVIPRLKHQGWKVSVMTLGADKPGSVAEREDMLLSCPDALLVVDQFEELFASDVTEDDRRCFIGRLARLPAVVIALRADFYGQCLRYPELVHALQEDQVIVGPVSEEDLRLMIREPAEKAGLILEPGLADTLLEEAGLRKSRNQEAVLPLLSHALYETWRLRSGNQLTLRGYRATGGIENAIGQAAESVYEAMDTAGKSRMRDLLLQMVRLGDDTEDTRRQLPLAQLTGLDHQILDALARRRLATISAKQAELAHDAMLYAWERLRNWIRDTRTALVAAGPLDDAARLWEQAGQDGYLYTGTRLAAAEETMRDERSTSLPEEVRERIRRFLEASQGRQRAEEQAARRYRQRRRAVLSVICALILAAGTVSVISVQQHDAAARHAAVIQSADLAADAAALQSTDPGLAAQLAVAAYRTSPTEAASAQLYASASLPVDSTVGSVGQRVVAVTAQAGGPLAAASDAGGRLLHVWDIASPSAPVLQAEITVHLPQGKVTALALAPRQPLLAAGCSAGAVCLWNVAKRGAAAVTARILLSAGSHGAPRITSMTFSPDGRLLALGSMNDGTLLYTVASPADPRLLAVLPDTPSTPGSWLGGVAFSPDGRLLAQTVQTGATKLWSLTDPARPEQVASIASGYQDVAFSPDSTLLAAVGDTSIGLWNITRPTRPSSVAILSADTGTATDTYSEDLHAVAFTPDGQYLAYTGDPVGGDGLGMIGLLDVSPASLSNPIPVIENTGSGNASLVPTAGDALLTGGNDGVVRLWRTPEPEATGTEASGPTDWSVSHDGHLMAAPVQPADSSALTRDTGIWDISGKTPVLDATLPVDPAAAEFLGNATDALLTVDLDGSVTLWNLTHPRQPVRAAALGSMVLSDVSQSSPNGVVTSDAAGTLTAVLGTDGSLRLWRIGKGPRATLVGSIQVPDPLTDLAGVLHDGQHAVIITPQDLQWWDIADPAHPTRIGSSPTATANKGSGTGGGNLFAETDQLDDLCDCSKLDIFSLAGRHVTSSATLSGQASGELAVSSDGRLLASGGTGGNGLTLWNLRNPTHPRELAALQTVPAITGITLSPNDMLLADWNEQTLQLWTLRDPASPALVTSLAFQAQPSLGSPEYELVGGAEFTSSGSTLAVSANYSVIFLDTDPAAVASRFCKVTGAAITHAQWQLHAPGIPYQNPCGSS
jgi:WD40 repeat protein